MSVQTYTSEPVSANDAALRTVKRFKNPVAGFVDEVIMPSEDKPDQLYMIIYNASTGERRCPCTSWVFKSRQGQTCKHITRYLAILADEQRNDPVVIRAGQIVDDIFAVCGMYGGSSERNRAVGLVVDRLRGFVPLAGQNGAGAPAGIVPGRSLRRIRF